MNYTDHTIYANELDEYLDSACTADLEMQGVPLLGMVDEAQHHKLQQDIYRLADEQLEAEERTTKK